MNKVFVYGTLRPGTGPTVELVGEMFDLGWFPGVVSFGESDKTFQAEVIEVDDKGLARLDSYEGFYPNNPTNSLYLRAPCRDGFIYVYNGDVTGKFPVPTGDWLEYTGRATGSNAGLGGKS